jgi:hypothetical protein
MQRKELSKFQPQTIKTLQTVALEKFTQENRVYQQEHIHTKTFILPQNSEHII